MSDTLVVTFQAQLSIVMETILKSAMMEITRLVEDSFVEEVSRGKQEVALLMRRLQFAENKLKERRVRCADCGRATASSERTADHTEETLTGTDTLCVSLSLREQSEKTPTFSEVWRSDESLDLHISTEARTRTEKTDTLEQSGKQDSASNNTAQLPPSVLQKLVPSAAVTRIHDPCTDLKPRESHCKTPVIDLSPIKETDSAQSRLIQNGIGDSGCGELASSLSGPTVKSELEPDPVPIKEEEEMLPVWDYSDGSGPAETDQSHRGIGGPWNREETQVDNFPNLTALNMPDPASYLMSCSVNCNTEMSQSIKTENSQSVTTDLVHIAVAHMAERSSSHDQNENGHLFSSNRQSFPEGLLAPQELCSGEKVFLPVLPLNHFSQSERLQAHESLHANKPHCCVYCGKSFAQVGHLKVHMLSHQGKKPLSCSQCNKTFVHNFELKDHYQRQHSGERPHVCHVCGKGFTRLSNFKQHQNIHTREKLFNCTHCGMRFNRSTHLRIHLRRHSRVGKSCHCRQCGKTFVCLKQLKGHLLKVHGTVMN